MAEGAPRASLTELALLFLRLGTTAFGGPAAHIAMMENEVVVRRRWISHQRFLDMLGAANLIPGPSSSELAVFIGYDQAGLPGLLIAGVCFVLPAALMTSAIAWAYVRYGSLPRVEGILSGIKPVIVAIVAQALWGLAPKAIKRSRGLVVIGIGACVASAVGVDGLAVLVCAGLLATFGHAISTRDAKTGSALVVLPLFAAGPVAGSVSLRVLFLTFLKLGAVVFGSGYVLLAFLRADFVERLHWLTEAQLIDAIAVGQLTPGPVFTTATFIGYVVAGGRGALLATLGIFLPGFAMIAAIKPIVARVRRSAWAGAFLDGVNVASLALMAVVTAQLGHAAINDVATALLALVSLLLLVRFKLNSAWLILGGGAIGAIASQLA